MGTCRQSAPTTPAGGSTSTTSSGGYKRDRLKHDRVLEVAARLPSARRTVATHLQLHGNAVPSGRWEPPSGFLILVSSGSAARRTPRATTATVWPRSTRSTSRIEAGAVIFNYVAKSGQERYVALADDLVLRAVRDLLAAAGAADRNCLPTRTRRSGTTSAQQTSTATSRPGRR